MDRRQGQGRQSVSHVARSIGVRESLHADCRVTKTAVECLTDLFRIAGNSIFGKL